MGPSRSSVREQAAAQREVMTKGITGLAYYTFVSYLIIRVRPAPVRRIGRIPLWIMDLCHKEEGTVLCNTYAKCAASARPRRTGSRATGTASTPVAPSSPPAARLGWGRDHHR